MCSCNYVHIYLLTQKDHSTCYAASCLLNLSFSKYVRMSCSQLAHGIKHYMDKSWALEKSKLKPQQDTTVHLLEWLRLKKSWQYQVLTRKQSNWNSHKLLVRMQNVIASLGSGWQSHMKVNVHFIDNQLHAQTFTQMK